MFVEFKTDKHKLVSIRIDNITHVLEQQSNGTKIFVIGDDLGTTVVASYEAVMTAIADEEGE